MRLLVGVDLDLTLRGALQAAKDRKRVCAQARKIKKLQSDLEALKAETQDGDSVRFTSTARIIVYSSSNCPPFEYSAFWDSYDWCEPDLLYGTCRRFHTLR